MKTTESPSRSLSRSQSTSPSPSPSPACRPSVPYHGYDSGYYVTSKIDSMDRKWEQKFAWITTVVFTFIVATVVAYIGNEVFKQPEVERPKNTVQSRFMDRPSDAFCK